MITDNEKKVLRAVLTSFDEKLSINQLARELDLTPYGAYKILKKFEQKGFIKPKKIANIIFT